MGTTADMLTDALLEIEASRVALARGDLDMALFEMVLAERWHAVARALHIADHATASGAAVEETANSAEVGAKLRALRTEFMSAVRPAPAAPVAFFTGQVEGALAPILRELAQAAAGGGLAADVVKARANNAATILLGNFDIRMLPPEPKEGDPTT